MTPPLTRGFLAGNAMISLILYFTQRKRAYAEAATQGYLVAGSHLSFPGMGRVRSSGRGYVWLPVNYTVPK